MTQTPSFTQSPDLSGFDKFGQQTARRALSHGWVGKRSRRGHLVLRAPDGETTTAICPNNSARRTQKNALAPIKRWEASQVQI